jgi:hypothetical protein
MMLLFVVLRSAFLGTMENPEPRYTLQCFPIVLLLGGAWISGWKSRAKSMDLHGQQGFQNVTVDPNLEKK